MSAPWERQPGESPRAFQAFSVYRDLSVGERSISRVASDLVGAGDSPVTSRRRHGAIERWSTRHAWTARSAAWDAERDRARRAATLETTAETARRHAEAAALLLEAALEPARRLVARLAADPAALDELPLSEHAKIVAQLGRMVPALVQAERLARGVSTERWEAVPSPTAERGLVDEEHMMRVYAALEDAGIRPIPMRDAPGEV